MNKGNFMKDRGGRIVVIDFGCTNFLPVSFFAFALREGDDFTQRIAKFVRPPESARQQLNALLEASYALVPYDTNNIGKQGDAALFPFTCLSFPHQKTELNVLHRYPSQAQDQTDITCKPSPHFLDRVIPSRRRRSCLSFPYRVFLG